jgi:sugar phosphate isomerase/epimerase
MKIGWCDDLASAPLLKGIGYDFIELPLAPMGPEDRATLAAAKRAVRGAPLPTSVFNVFFPKDMKVVGPEMDAGRVRGYLAGAAELLAEAEAKVAVLGSGWARNVPNGWERSRAEAQWLQALSWCADALAGSGTTLAIEPLNRKESNIVNSVAEGVRFARDVNRLEIRVLADFYHMNEEGEPLETVKEHASWLAHVHLADTGRRNPGTGSYDYDRFFGYLKETGYSGMISAECKVEHPEPDMRHSLRFLRRHWPVGGVAH